MTLQEQFAADVAAFIKAKKMKPTIFGREAIGDPNFVFELNRDRSPSLKTVEKVREYMARHADDMPASEDAA